MSHSLIDELQRYVNAPIKDGTMEMRKFYNEGLETAIKIIRQHESDSQKQTDKKSVNISQTDALIEKMQNLKGDSYVGNQLRAYFQGIAECIEIVRQHEAENVTDREQSCKKEQKQAKYSRSVTSDTLNRWPDCYVELHDLVMLKKHKDKHGKDAYYEAAQPAAWKTAQAAIEKRHALMLATMQGNASSEISEVAPENGPFSPALLDDFAGCPVDDIDTKMNYQLTGTHLKQFFQSYRMLYRAWEKEREEGEIRLNEKSLQEEYNKGVDAGFKAGKKSALDGAHLKGTAAFEKKENHDEIKNIVDVLVNAGIVPLEKWDYALTLARQQKDDPAGYIAPVREIICPTCQKPYSEQPSTCSNTFNSSEYQEALKKRESGRHPLEYCTYVDGSGNLKFNTDFVPQVIAAYEMNIQKYEKGNWPGAVYKAMEDALNEFFLTRIEGEKP